jgi:hypothetical protein
MAAAAARLPANKPARSTKCRRGIGTPDAGDRPADLSVHELVMVNGPA